MENLEIANQELSKETFRESNTKRVMSESLQERIKFLSPMELMYFRMIYPQSGVLFIQSEPGIGKSSTFRKMCKILDWDFIDFRISQSDETDFKWPFLTEAEDGTKISKYAVPEWAVKANKKPTLIMFDELNRGSQFVLNAALQILLERSIGDYKLNENVFMVACGNLGEEDDTTVTEFDRALNNRLIHYKHTLTMEHWQNEFGNGNIHPVILQYLNIYPQRLNSYVSDNEPAYPSPRTWTFYSDFILQNFGFDANPTEWVDVMSELGNSYIGSENSQFIRYCRDMISLNINQVLNDFDNIATTLDSFARDKKSELISELCKIDIETLTIGNIDNAVKFLKTVSSDERANYILSLLDNPDPDNCETEKAKRLLVNFREDIIAIQEATQESSSN